MHVLEVAQEHVRGLQDEPVTVPLNQARHIAATPTTRAGLYGANDLTALASLLQLPIEVQALRADVNQLRSSLDLLRRALPPALLSASAMPPRR